MTAPTLSGLLSFASVSDVAPFAGPLETYAEASEMLLKYREEVGYVGRTRYVTYDVGDARNRGIAEARRQGCEWVFLLDADQLWTPETLLGLLRRQVPIVQALTLQREPPFLPVGYERREADGTYTPAELRPGEAGLKPVAVVGGGCLLIRRAAWEAIPEPWFQPGYVTGHRGTQGEDTAFSAKATDAGLPLYLDLDHPSGHLVLGTLTALRHPDGRWFSGIAVGGQQPITALIPAAVRKD